jgi:hypothetical protein
MSYLKHKPGSIEELMANEASKLNDNAYQDMFKKELDKAGKGIGGMSPKEKKDFFNKIDDKYKAKSEVKEEDAYDKDDEKPAPKPKPKKEELSAAQKKLPAGLQKAIKDKETKSESLINTYESLIKTWEAASHKMPDGTMMKGAKHKDETKDEANDVDNGDEKKPVATKDVKKLADSGSKLTKVETEPNADFKN